MATKIITADQELDLDLAVTDKYGNAASLDGLPVWASGDETIVVVLPDATGLKAVARAVGPAGKAQVSVRADADLGDGVREIVAVLDLEVVGGEASVILLNAGEPRVKPAA